MKRAEDVSLISCIQFVGIAEWGQGGMLRSYLEITSRFLRLEGSFR